MKSEEKLMDDEQLSSVSGGIKGMDVIGFLHVRVQTEIKTSPDLNAETAETVNWGGYRVYEIDTNQGLVWYRTALHKWIANNPQNDFTLLKNWRS